MKLLGVAILFSLSVFSMGLKVGDKIMATKEIYTDDESKILIKYGVTMKIEKIHPCGTIVVEKDEWNLKHLISAKDKKHVEKVLESVMKVKNTKKRKHSTWHAIDMGPEYYRQILKDKHAINTEFNEYNIVNLPCDKYENNCKKSMINMDATDERSHVFDKPSTLHNIQGEWTNSDNLNENNTVNLHCDDYDENENTMINMDATDERSHVFDKPITLHDIQGEWTNSHNRKITVKGTDVHVILSIGREKHFKIEESVDTFTLNGWILKKRSTTLTWEKNEDVEFWYQPQKENKIDEKPSDDLIAETLYNIYTRAEGNLKETKIDKKPSHDRIAKRLKNTYTRAERNLKREANNLQEIKEYEEKYAKLQREQEENEQNYVQEIKKYEEKETKLLEDIKSQKEKESRLLKNHLQEIKEHEEKEAKLLEEVEGKEGNYLQKIQEYEETHARLLEEQKELETKLLKEKKEMETRLLQEKEKNLQKMKEHEEKQKNKIDKKPSKNVIAATLKNIYTRAEGNLKQKEKESQLLKKHLQEIKEHEEKELKLLEQLKEKDKRLLKLEENHTNSLVEVTCAICYDVMVNPVQIPCGHNLCQLCLGNLINYAEGYYFKCPTCREFIDKDDPYPINFVLKGLIEKLDQ